MHNFLVRCAALAAVTMAAATGCQSWCRHTCPPGQPFAPGAPPPGGLPPGGDVPFAPGRPAAPPGVIVPPPPVPVTPQQEVRGFTPAPVIPDPTWRPIEQASVKLAPPVISDSNEPAGRTSLYPPMPDTGKPSGTGVTQAKTPLSAFPVGIPQFAIVKDGVATGLRPMLDDGLDWLQANGYRTVVFLRQPGEPDSADRRQVEKRGMKYLSLEVSPQLLTPQLAEDFNHLAADSSAQPLFVYDRDGALTGSLWYLYFRLAESAADEVARVRAGALGLRLDRDGPHREMWLAAQQVAYTAK